MLVEVVKDPEGDEAGTEGDTASSSSSGLRRSEISTLPEVGELRWRQSVCAAVKEKSTATEERRKWKVKMLRPGKRKEESVER
jgi:hypothetical protein